MVQRIGPKAIADRNKVLRRKISCPMRHGKKLNHLGRKAAHRKALMRNLANALIEHKRIKTTLAKAKALRQYIEPLVTKAKSNTTHSRRVVFSYLQNKEAIKELFGAIAEKTLNRPGGYVRVIRTGFRQGDGAEMALIEFVDFNEIYKPGKEAGTGKKRRRRRGGAGGGQTVETATAPPATEVAEEEVMEVSGEEPGSSGESAESESPESSGKEESDQPDKDK